LVGGSMLYIASVLNDFEFPGTDVELRARLEAELEEVGPITMHKRLAELDPVAASRIIPQNGRRTVRAIEIVTMTGQSFAAALPEVPVEWQSSLQIGINGPREELVGRLEQRVHKMWKLGLVAEVERLLEHGLRDAKTAKRAIGYAQALA
jgi:tRNA dimethylallyltransferase